MSQTNTNLRPSEVQTWLIDFDETLASGILTWALEQAFPKFISDHHLTYDKSHLQQTMLRLQQRSRENPDTPLLLNTLFEIMDWPRNLQDQFLADIRSNYQPTLFEDTLPFLQQLHQAGRQVFIVSNNKRTPDHINLVGIDSFIDGVFTPHSCPDTQPKPHSSLWTYLTAQNMAIDPRTTGVIGDDPWADGAFAEACGLPCWLIDRTSRFSDMYTERPYHWVRSLGDILGN
jgi:FMN phosphatase YigB (HAD superfamily)